MSDGGDVLGVGIDIVSIDRFARSAETPGFLETLLGAAELSALPPAGPRRMEAAAASFAVKEAVLKAVGTGAWQDGTDFPDVLVDLRQGPVGAVSVELGGGAAALVAQMGGASVHAGLTRAGRRVVAFAMLCAEA
jgi:holo-[acyl-carrier protein] synthase